MGIRVEIYESGELEDSVFLNRVARITIRSEGQAKRLRVEPADAAPGDVVAEVTEAGAFAIAPGGRRAIASGEKVAWVADDRAVLVEDHSRSGGSPVRPRFRPSKQMLSNALLLTATLALGLAVAEVGLRGYRKLTARYSADAAQTKAQAWVRSKSEDAFDREDAYFGKWDQFATMRYSSYLGYWPASHQVGNGYRTNNFGFRNDDDIATEKAPGEFRVFLVGGSAAWGAGVRQDDTVAASLQAKLQSEVVDGTVTVWVAAVGAYLSTHERIVVINKLAALAPDVIVQLSGWNDIYAGYRGFSVMDDRWDYTASASILGQYHNLFVYDDDSARMTDPGAPTRQDHDLAIFELADQLYYAKRLAALRRPTSAVVDDLVTNLGLARAAVPQSTAYVFALQPTVYATEKQLTEWEKSILGKNQAATPAYGEYNAKVYAEYRKRLASQVKALDIAFFDMDHAIASQKSSLFADHVHFGDRGNRLLGEHLAKILVPMLQQR